MIPLAAIGGAAAIGWAFIASSTNNADGGPADDIISEDEGATVAASTSIPTAMSNRTLQWQDELADQAPELDTAVLLRWIQRESDGNPGAVGSIKQLLRDGWAREAGIGQVFFESRGQRVFGVTTDELRAGAMAGSQSLSRDLTPPERLAQTSSLIAMCRAYIVDGGHVLVELGAEWSAPDIYCLAKLKHALPVLAGTFLRHCPDAGSWDSFRAWLESISLPESIELYAGSTTYYPWTRYLNNAQYTGRGD